MTLKQRRFLYLTLIIFFLLISPIILVYSLGYRYNFSQKRIQKTGALYLRTFPDNAEIILNNKPTGINTPNKIVNLLPGEYQIEVKKDGYFPWQKKLNIQSSLTTFAEDIYLFKDQLTPQQLNIEEVENFFASPTRKKIIYTINDQGVLKDYLFYFNSFKSELINNSSQVKTFISWSNDETKILAQTKNQHFFVIDLNNQNKVIDLWQNNNLIFDYLYWDDQSSNILWGLVDQQFYKIDLLTNQVDKIDSPKIFNFLPDTEGFYYIFQKPDSTSLTVALAKYKKFEEVKEIGELPFSKTFQMKKIADWLFIYNPEELTLYLLKLNNQQLLFYNILKSVNGFEIKNNNLLYWNDYEYWIYNLENQNNLLIERLSTPILNVFWHPEANYLFVETANDLKIIETDDRDQKNSYKIIQPSTPILNQITFDPGADILVFAAKISGTEGIFYLNLE